MRGLIKRWIKKDDASAAVEAAFLFPLMITIFLGTVDIGTAISVNQKVIGSSHMMVDLLTRNTTVTTTYLNDVIIAAKLAMTPYDTASFGYDIQSIKIGEPANPQWNETDNMSMNANVMATLTGAGYVGADGEGVIAVTVKYTYVPMFSYIMTGSFDMEEVSFARGRKGGFISRT